ncbi:MAG: sugar efflux transporter [Opitutae bacterium]|nr:sugar efflux transporter [Opitutae bacterium]
MQRLIAPCRTIFQLPGFATLLVCNFLLGLAQSFVSPFYSMFGTLEVGMTPFMFGVFMTVTSVSAIGLSTVLARWSDTRYSRRTMLLLGGLCGAAAYGAFAVVRDAVWLTVIGSLVLGIGSITVPQLFALAREQIARSGLPPADTPLYMNVFRMFFALAWTVGPAIAAWVMQHYSFRGTFGVAAFFFLSSTLVVAFAAPAVPPGAAHEQARKMPMRQMFQPPGLLAYFLGFCLFFVCTTMCIMNLPLFVLHSIGGTATHVGIIYSLAPIFELPFMIYFGLLAAHCDQAKLIRIGIFIAAVYYGGLALAQAPWHIYPLQILSAAFVAVTNGIAITFFQSFLPNQAGAATSLYFNAARIGSTVGYLLFGSLASTCGYRSVFLVCTVLSATVLVIFHQRRKLHLPAAA